MAAPESILLKIKLLQSLSSSPNQNEADNALAMIEKLIAKYNISQEELDSIKEKKPLYGEDNNLYHSIELISWKQQLALAVGKYFFCHIIQEELVSSHGFHEYNYYVYGDPEDETNVKFVFNSFNSSIEDLVRVKCIGRGQIYISSYCEGVVESIKNNIQWEGIDLPNLKKPNHSISHEDKLLSNGQSNLTKHKEEKERPVENSVDVNRQSLIKDVMAYFRGLEDGKDLSLREILELAADVSEPTQLNVESIL